jgi:hypothetical protein
MKDTKSWFLAAVCALPIANGCKPARQVNEVAPSRNSILAIAATPEKYDGRKIIVIGYLSLRQENYALFLHEEDFRREIYSNAIWLHMSSDQEESYKSYDGQYCVIEGIFRSGDFGFGGFYAGAMDVTRISDYIDATTRSVVEQREKASGAAKGACP